VHADTYTEGGGYRITTTFGEGVELLPLFSHAAIGG